MAKINFSKEEIDVLKKAAEEYHRGGADQAQAFIDDSGITIDVCNELKQLNAPESGMVNGDGCYACVICVAIFAVIALAYAK